MPKPKSSSLLKNVLIRSLSVPSSTIYRSRAVFVLGLAKKYCELQSDYDQSAMDAFLQSVGEVTSGEFYQIETSSIVTLRESLSDIIPLLLESLKPELPNSAQKIESIDWQKLFGIGPSAAVKINIVSGSDEETGGGGSEILFE